MSLRVFQKDLTKQQILKIRKLCIFQPAATQFNKNPQSIKLIHKDGEKHIIPFGMWKEIGLERPNTNSRAEDVQGVFTGQLLEEIEPVPGKHTVRDQKTVAKEALKRLRKEGYVLLALHTGFGKTCLGTMLAARKRKKTLVICKSDRIKSQWVEAFEKFTSCTAKIMEGKVLPDTDVCIMGPKKCSNFQGDLSRYGTVIVDECHQICTEVFTECLFKVQPENLIGLTATPDRKDGMGEILVPFFGSDPIERKEVKDFSVYKVVTGIRPDIDYDYRGKIIWSKVIASISSNQTRQELAGKFLVSLGKEEGKTIILGKRKEELENIYNITNSEVKSSLYIASKKTYDPEAKLIFSTVGKGGVGLDDKDIKNVVLLSDCLDVRQYEGRSRQVNSRIFDFVDLHSSLENHWKERELWYTTKGATIKGISLRKLSEWKLEESPEKQ